MTHPVEIIQKDHRAVEQLFKKYEDLDREAFGTKRKVAEKIIKELKTHAAMEERIFYPKVKELLKSEDSGMVELAYTEHDVANRLLEELSVTHPEDPQFDARVKVLNETVTHHIKEEEEELLPKLMHLAAQEQLHELGKDMERFKLEHGEDNGHLA